MFSGNDCPICQENIGLVAVFKAPVPNRIYCPHCGERLRYGDTNGLIALALFLAVLVLAASISAAYLAGFEAPLVSAVLAFAVLIFGFIGLEIAFVFMLWYGKYRLESVNRPKSEWDDEPF